MWLLAGTRTTQPHNPIVRFFDDDDHNNDDNDEAVRHEANNVTNNKHNEPLADQCVNLERCMFFLSSALWIEKKGDETAAKKGLFTSGVEEPVATC